MDDSDLYLVRVWRSSARFRASARRVDEESAHLFIAPDELARYLTLPCDAQADPRHSPIRLQPAPQGESHEQNRRTRDPRHVLAGAVEPDQQG
jgi:hypothetical protein